MTWRLLAVLLPAGCAASAFTHWVNQWATRTINRHVRAVLDEPNGQWGIGPSGAVLPDQFDDFSRADSVAVSDNWARWEGELDRPYSWQDDGL